MSRDALVLGVRVKTARATAIAVSGTAAKPAIAARRELTLYDPKVPHSGQPYHLPLEIGEAKAAPLLAKALAAVRKAARRELGALVESLEKPRALALVVGSLGDPAKLGNPHVRAHALEGQLYWKVLDEAARELGLACTVVTEKEVYALASVSLGLGLADLRERLTELGKSAGKPWGAEEKTAALAGWSALA